MLGFRCQGNKYNVLVTDQLFACEPSASVKMAHIEGNRSVERPPVEDRLYEVIRAPYIAQLNAITNKYLERPLSLYDKARYLLFGKCLHHVMLPTCFVSAVHFISSEPIDLIPQLLTANYSFV